MEHFALVRRLRARLRLPLRLQLAGVLLLALLGFAAYNVQESTNALSSARLDTTRREVLAIARTFDAGFSPSQLADVGTLRRRLRAVRVGNPELLRTSLYVIRRGFPVRLVLDSAAPTKDVPGLDDVAPLATDRSAYHELAGGATRYAELDFPVGPAGRPAAVLGLYFNLRAVSAGFTSRAHRLLVLGLLAALLTTLLVLGALERLLFGPLRALKAATREIGQGETDIRLAWRRRDELGQLANEFDRMAEAVQERERLEELALRDSLTGLANHRAFHAALDSELQRAQAAGTPLALVAIDLDHFKAINDQHGHPVGDEVLQAVAGALAELVRATDTVARLGGEEFALLLPGVGANVATQIAEQARQAVSELAVSCDVAVRCSAGVAAYPLHAIEGPTLLEFADGALYWAKRAGRNQVRVYDPHHVSTATSDRRRAEIVAVLEDPEAIRPVFQPLLDLHTGAIAGYEALARFPKSGSGRTPDVWVAEAHRCGLGADLEAQAVRAALAVQRPERAFLSVNLSPSVAGSRQVLDALPEDLSGLVLELTEHEVLGGDGTTLHDTLAELRARGARIAVDDAGAGYAGLQHVMQLRPDIIKLDRALVSGVAADAARAALIECFVTFARRTGAQVCAEGIEDPADLSMLATLGVDYAQGYLLARPADPWTDITPAASETLAQLGAAGSLA